MLRELDMKYNIFFYFNSSFRTLFYGSGFFAIGSGFLADPDPGRKKNRIRNTVFATTVRRDRQARSWEILVITLIAALFPFLPPVDGR